MRWLLESMLMIYLVFSRVHPLSTPRGAQLQVSTPWRRICYLIGWIGTAAILIWQLWPPYFTERIEIAAIVTQGGFAYSFLPSRTGLLTRFEGDSEDAPTRSKLVVLEDGRPLQHPHSVHPEIRSLGFGRYSHWKDAVYFSASDNTDPRTNDRSYTVLVPQRPVVWLASMADLALVVLSVVGLVRIHRRYPTASQRAMRVFGWIGTAAILIWQLWPPYFTERIEIAAIVTQGGFAYSFLPRRTGLLTRFEGDSEDAPTRSKLVVLEDGRPLQHPHSVHPEIRSLGFGRYSHGKDVVYFSASDNTDPRTNNRSYTVLVPQRPVVWLASMADLALVVLSVVGLVRIHHRYPTASQRAMRLFGWAPMVGLFVLAVLATTSHFVPLKGEVSVPEERIAVVDKDNGYYYVVAGLATPRALYIPFSRLVAPFLIVPTPTASAEIVPFEVLWNGVTLRQAVDMQGFRSSPIGAFLDLDKVLGDGLLVLPPDSADHAPARTVTVRYPYHVTSGGTLALWVLFGLVLLGKYTLARLATRPTSEWCTSLCAMLCGGAGVILTSLNLWGNIEPLRGFSPQDPLPAGPFLLTAGTALVQDWDRLDKQLERRKEETKEEYATRINRVVAENVLHIWNYGNTERLRLQVPIWENYYLWFLGEMRDDYRRYHFADARKALKRGVGMCGQASLIVVGILREAGLDARVVQLNGHTVATAEVAPGSWVVLDPDIGVVVSKSLAEIENDPRSILSIYEEGFRRLTYQYPRIASEMFATLYGPEGNAIEPANGNVMMGESWVAREQLAYRIKWSLPLTLLAISLVLWLIQLSLRKKHCTEGTVRSG